MGGCRKRADDRDDVEEECSEDDDDKADDDEEEECAVPQVVRKKKQVKKRPGRKSRWCPKSLDDFIDIIVNNDLYKKKLIFVNTKNQSNGVLYEKVLQELKHRASSRGDKFTFKVPQLRTKFKKCASICKQAALTQKTATGIKRFQEEQGLGKWFAALYEVVKTRDSCQPDQALEPSSSEKSFNDDDDNHDAAELFVPVKKIRKRVTAKDKLDTTTTEVLNLVREVVSNDPTRDLLNFMREEMDKSRQHELQLFQMLQSRRTNSGSDLYHHQATTYPAYPPTQPTHLHSLTPKTTQWHQCITRPGRGGGGVGTKPNHSIFIAGWILWGPFFYLRGIVQ